MKVSIVKESVVIIASSITEAQLKLLAEANPQALVLKDSDGNETFRVDVTAGEPGISKFGLTLNPKKDIVINYDRPIDEEFVKKEFGVKLLKLGALEVQIEAAYAEFQAHSGQINFELL